MRREIKFKFWLGHTKKMTYEHSLIEISHAAWDFTEDIIPLQFTGLHDKNGKELYASDMFKDSKETIYRCYNVVGGFAHSLPQFPSTLKEESAWPLQPLADEQTVSWFESNCEVIGNIYENPELLK